MKQGYWPAQLHRHGSRHECLVLSGSQLHAWPHMPDPSLCNRCWRVMSQQFIHLFGTPVQATWQCLQHHPPTSGMRIPDSATDARCINMTCRYAGVVPKCPRSVYAVVTLTGGGKHAGVSLSFANLGPQTSETESCFKALTTYAVPR